VKNSTAANRTGETAPASGSLFASLLRRGSIWLLAVALIYAFELFRDFSALSTQIDFSHYYASALAMREGIDPYTTDLTPIAASLGLDLAEMKLATYPPTFVLCFEPLTLLPPVPAHWVWAGMNVVFLAIALYLLLDGLPADTDLRLALAGLAILYAPVTDNFFYAQTQILILLLLVLFMRWMKSGRYALAGSALALAVLLKVFPAVLVCYLVLRRKERAIAYTGLGVVLGGVVTLVLVGVARSLHFLQVLPFLISSDFLGRPENVALAAMVTHLFRAVSQAARLELARRVAVLIADLGLLALTAHATLKSSKLSDGGDEHVIALWVVATVLLSPTAWMHYLVLFLLPFAVFVRLHLRGEAPPVAAGLELASYSIVELLMVVYLALGALAGWMRQVPAWAPVPSMVGWNISLLLAYAGAYLLAVQTMPARVAAASAAPIRR